MEEKQAGRESRFISRRKVLATIGAAAAGAIAVSGSVVGFGKEAVGANCAICLDSLADLIALDESELHDGQCFCVKGYRAGTSHGGGTYVWDASRGKGVHNGGTVIDPNRPFPTDWTNDGQVANWFAADAAGQGCYTRIGDAAITPEMFGADPGGVIPSQRQITRCAAAHGGIQLSSKATYLCTDNVYFTKGSCVAGYGRSTNLRFTSGGVVLSGTESKEFSLENFLITTAGTGQIALDIIDANVNTAPTRWSLRNLFLYSETAGQGTGCRIRGGWIASVFNLVAQRFAVGVDIVRSDSPPNVGFNGVSFVGGELQGNGVGFRSRSPLGVNFFGTAIEGNTQFGARLENGTRQVNFDGVYFESNGTANVNNGSDIAIDVDDPLATIYGIAVRGSIFLRGSSGCKRAIVVNKAIGLYVDPACSFHGYENALVLNEIVANGVRGGLFDTRSLLSVTGQPVINNTLQYGNPTRSSFSLGNVAAGPDTVTDGWLGFVAFGTGIANRGAVDVCVHAEQAGTASFRLAAIDTATNAPLGTDTLFNASLTAGINKVNVAYNFESGGLKGKYVAFRLSRQGDSPADTNAGGVTLIECFVQYYV
ncbi:hypothetical protein FE783_34355 [Paenibacillus mesophilus]|uniref:hypothetical protein n=1 Tax=Paenibacillus mesophilus TaxID=2582849 RepID=UPI00110E1DD0|nr:hypothetical protein [Paenibacillus mesophilus]TMV43726.1 hypothetical protein FE783_34355 [Paenibacillus mesophilus]